MARFEVPSSHGCEKDVLCKGGWVRIGTILTFFIYLRGLALFFFLTDKLGIKHITYTFLPPTP